ncbi:MAG: diguanylate cyclase [Deltaproteobacteria bacterium]|nr:MAG: diguanylate cyclase [Deltaproteobacteria bacterium]
MPDGKILIVDDDRIFRGLCSDILTKENYEVKLAPDGKKGLSLLKKEDFNLVVTDLIMPDISGLAILEWIKQNKSHIDVILVTGQASVETAVKALKLGAADYVRKPFNTEEFKILVNRCLEQRKIFEENKEMKQALEIFDACRAISTCFEQSRLYQLTLDAFSKMVKGDFGIGLFYSKNSSAPELKAYKGLNKNEAKILRDVVLGSINLNSNKLRDESFLQELKTSSKIKKMNMDLLLALVAPVRNKDKIMGILVIFRLKGSEEFTKKDMAVATFVGREVSFALENAVKYIEAKELSYIDDLTELHNPRYLEIAMDREIRRAKRYKSKMALLFLDLDYFKNVNDTYGHTAGGKVLTETGRVLMSCVREVDSVVRYGGDEYTIILVEADSKRALQVAERIRKAVENYTFLSEEGLNIKMTTCIGVACYPDDAKNKADLLDLADKAMYRGKDTGRNAVHTAGSLRKKSK